MREDKRSADVQRKGGRRTPALIDPLVLARQGLRRMFQSEPTKLRNRRRKDVPDGDIDAYYTNRLATLRDAGMPIDREVEIAGCVDACNCGLPLARAGWQRQFPTGAGARLTATKRKFVSKTLP
jgi:hypothetical protein